DRADGSHEPAHAGDGPPGVLAEHPDAAPRLRRDPRDHEGDIEAERVICDEDRTTFGQSLDAVDVDAQPPPETVERVADALRDGRRVPHERVLVAELESIERH